MQKDHLHRWNIVEISLSIFVLSILLFFTYGAFIRAPYIGLYFNPSNGSILQIFTPNAKSLQLGDVLTKVGDISWQQYYENSGQGLFNDLKSGEIVDINVNRNGKSIAVQWKIPGFNQAEFYARFFNIWWLAYIFWFFGFTAQVFVRPKDTRWRLLVAFNYLTGIWIILGVLSARHLWASSILLRAITWTLPPVYLHFHWLFPKPLAATPKRTIATLYTASALLFLGELAEIFPRSFYALGLLLALLGIVVLQIIHFIKHREQRRDVGLVALAIILAILPSLALSITGIIGVVPQLAPIGLLTLPFMPLTYFFIIYRRQLGDQEIRANRFFSFYAFLILLTTIFIILVAPIASLQIPGNVSLLIALGTALFTVFISIRTFPSFQSFIEQRFLGIKLPYQNLQETYSARITTSTTLSNLLGLLDDDVFPSLFVRQFAFLQMLNGNSHTLLAKNVAANELSAEDGISDLVMRSGKYIPESSAKDEWIRLILPLKVGDDFIGFWLLGRRDPDDYYPLVEIPILQSIANQTAIALSNILHAEQLKKIYQLDIERYEEERLRLALDLHDSILNQLAVLRNNLDEGNISAKFQTSYEELTRRLREIVSNLRPPMLMYGIKPAIEELADNLMERSGDKIKIKVDIQADDERLPQNIEQHLFRIVQEACENTLRHAAAKTITVSGTFTSKDMALTIADDGAGFDAQFELNNLLANNHFGLAGMVERCHLIDAEINIQSKVRLGTSIQITWKKT